MESFYLLIIMLLCPIVFISSRPSKPYIYAFWVVWISLLTIVISVFAFYVLIILLPHMNQLIIYLKGL